MPSSPPAIVTTPDRAAEADVAVAETWAARLGLPLVRRRRGVPRLATEHGAEAVLVAGVSGCTLWAPPVPVPLHFHGSLGRARIRALARGGRDALVEAAGVRPGDVVIDATGGSLSDALVVAHVVGPGGSVTALESSALVWATMACGRERAPVFEPPAEAARQRLRLEHADHARWLRAQPADSADLVFFDPMFAEATASRPEFEVMRRVADPRPLTSDTVAEAARVARRGVVLVDGPGGSSLRALGFERVGSPRPRRRCFGLLRTD